MRPGLRISNLATLAMPPNYTDNLSSYQDYPSLQMPIKICYILCVAIRNKHSKRKKDKKIGGISVSQCMRVRLDSADSTLVWLGQSNSLISAYL